MISVGCHDVIVSALICFIGMTSVRIILTIKILLVSDFEIF